MNGYGEKPTGIQHFIKTTPRGRRPKGGLGGGGDDYLGQSVSSELLLSPQLLS